MAFVIVYDPNDPAMYADPYPTYRRLREEEPTFHSAEPGFWALSRHADVSAAWRDFELYSNDHGVSIDLWGPDARTRMSFIAMDPPDHTRFRALISRGFTPARVQRLQERIRELTRAYLEPALDKGSFDFVDDFAAMIPAEVICELIGVPKADRAMVLRLSNGVMNPGTAADAGLELGTYLYSLTVDRRKRPSDDLATALVEAEIDGDRLSDVDITATMMLLGVAGNETTVKLLATAWRLAWQHPDQRVRAFSDVAAWVEESLRFEGPSQYTARRLTRDIELYGTPIPAGARVLLLIAAANRDGTVFRDGERFVVGRDTSATLAFGTGRHFCLGASLARMEARIVLEELAAAVRPDYEVDLAGAEWGLSPSVRGHTRLPTSVVRR